MIAVRVNTSDTGKSIYMGQPDSCHEYAIIEKWCLFLPAGTYLQQDNFVFYDENFYSLMTIECSA